MNGGGDGLVARLRAHWPLLAALAVVAAGRVLLFDWPVYPDEAGFYLVASDLLHHGGDGLYGHYFVDRPPTLIWLYLIGAAVGDVLAMRMLVAALLLAFVALAWSTVRRLNASSRWAVAVAAAFAISPEVGAETANGEAFAVPFVMAGLYCVVRVTQGTGAAALRWATAAGFLGFLAISVKQNFADVFVFAIVLLVGLGLRRQRTWATVVRQLGAGVLGAVVAASLVVGYALSTKAGLEGLWLAAVDFRTDANQVLAEGDRTGINTRIDLLTRDAWLAGLIPLAIVLVVLAVRWRFRVSALSYAVGSLVAFEAVCVVLGGNFWAHYLMGLAPGMVLAAGIWGRHLPVAAVSSYLVVAALVAVPLNLHRLAEHGPDRSQEVGQFVRRSGEPGDTATVLYGKADLQWATGMRSPYEHLWSLPVRTLDPDLDELGNVLSSDDAPTWLIQTFARHSWGLDPEGTIDPIIRREYDLVWEGCDHLVFLHHSAERTLSTTPPEC